jgi:hypothetical protein
MQVQKLHVKANGLVPAGAYFANIAAKLEEMNVREAAIQEDLNEEDRALEAMYRKRPAARFTPPVERHAMM